MKIWVAAIATATFAAPALAQSQQPYAGLETRTIKALSEEQVFDLKAGRGMGLALAAELNGYPGPRHVLELADPLELSPEQRTRVSQLFDGMASEAVTIGERLIAQEAELDRQFAERRVTPQTLSDTVAAIGATQAALREVHLKYHLYTLEILTPAQVHRYAELRGYAGPQRAHGKHHH